MKDEVGPAGEPVEKRQIYATISTMLIYIYILYWWLMGKVRYKSEPRFSSTIKKYVKIHTQKNKNINKSK